MFSRVSPKAALLASEGMKLLKYILKIMILIFLFHEKKAEMSIVLMSENKVVWSHAGV